MKNNLVEKTVGKWILWTIVSAVLVVIGVVIACVFGFNTTVDLKSAKTVTVEYSYVSESSDLDGVCKTSFAKSSVKPLKSVVSGEEIVYYFDVNTDLTEATATLKTDIEAAMQTGGALEDASLIQVRSNTENFQKGLSEGYILRAGIAIGVFAVLAFVYVALRYKLSMGITMAAAMLAAGGLTVALVAVTRIPVTASFVYAVVFAVMAAVVMTLITFNRFRDNAKDKDKEKELSAKQRVVAAVDTKNVMMIAVALTLVVGVLGAILSVARWFALSAFVGIVSATFASWILAPALLAVWDKAIKSGDKPLFKTKKKAKESVTAELPTTEEKAEEPQA
ncbi:MAG: hypothetical protein IJX18_01930 [Clostridia bacterium]|nr:hypothetical protein [Clostridia bacterium]